MLTDSQIRKLPKPGKYPSLHADTNGLYLKYATTGRKTWVYRSRKGGQWKVKKIGDYPAIKLNVARAKVAALVNQAFTAPLTNDLVDEFWHARIEKRYKKQKNVRVYANRLKVQFGHIHADELSTRQLIDSLKIYANDAPVAANRCLAFWKLIFRFAKESGYLQTSPISATTAKTVGGEETRRDITLSDDEIAALWASEHLHAPLLRALLLTGCRISELQAASLNDIYGETLHIPDTKSKRPHWVHITPLLQEQLGDFNGKLFQAVSPTAVQARLRRQKSLWRPHDLRRTFATIAAQTQPPYVLSKCLNHVLPGMLSIYNKHDYPLERQQASIDVANYVLKVCK